MNSFTEILADTGKTDKNTRHSYGDVYDWWFAPFREKSMNVLEIGVCDFGGGCVLSLAESFQDAQIWGIDIDLSKCCAEAIDHPRISLIKADAYNEDAMTDILFGNGMFHIIIDDGIHEIEAQLKLLKFLSEYLSEGGIYCIEDCVTEQWLPHLADLRALGFQQTIVDMSTDEQPDNTIIRFSR